LIHNLAKEVSDEEIALLYKNSQDIRLKVHPTKSRRALAAVGKANMARDAACTEILRMWAHTLTSGQRKALSDAGITLPTLPVFIESEEEEEDYASAFTCMTGHGITAKVANGSYHILPHWPTEVT